MEREKQKLVTKCPCCKKFHIVEVFLEDLDKYEDGMSIAEAFPYLNEDERELLITGLCKDCWDKEFYEG
ncbi:MAG: hypothetical protein HUJ56_03680 [Erysipelotrichaceae bacterium]|nr:hypothetical protein [Erysipelotrichaceae bacterium]